MAFEQINNMEKVNHITEQVYVFSSIFQISQHSEQLLYYQKSWSLFFRGFYEYSILTNKHPLRIINQNCLLFIISTNQSTKTHPHCPLKKIKNKHAGPCGTKWIQSMTAFTEEESVLVFGTLRREGHITSIVNTICKYMYLLRLSKPML